MFDRIMGVITLKAPVYRAIADDQTATGMAATVFIVVTLIQNFFTGLVVTTSSGSVHASLGDALIHVIVGLIIGLIAWVFTAWVLSFVAKLLDGKTSTSEMLRVTGFVQVFSLVNVINVLVLISPAIGCVTSILALVVGILQLVGYVIGVREAAEFTTAKAIITGIVAVVVNFIIVLVIGGAIVGLIAAAVAVTQ
jgi:hypothetical protein